MLIECVLLNAQYAYCMRAAQFSICSLYACCSVLNMLIVCSNSQYDYCMCAAQCSIYSLHVCFSMLNMLMYVRRRMPYMLIRRVHARVSIVCTYGLPCVCVQKSEFGEIGRSEAA